MNWDAITSALAAIDYNESFTFEVAGAFMPPIKELRLPAAKYLHEIGNYLIGEIERKKAK
jgi:sugar phosphate isomerase/epimerase